MTPRKLIEVFRGYKNRLAVSPEKLPDEQYDAYYGHDIRPKEAHSHLVWMCDQAIDFVAEGRIEKAMRWLGFIQGVFWVLSLKTLNELRDDSKPAVDAESIREVEDERILKKVLEAFPEVCPASMSLKDVKKLSIEAKGRWTGSEPNVQNLKKNKKP